MWISSHYCMCALKLMKNLEIIHNDIQWHQHQHQLGYKSFMWMKPIEILVYWADVFFTQKLTVIQMGVSGSDGSCTKLIQIYVRDVHEAYVFRCLCIYIYVYRLKPIESLLIQKCLESGNRLLLNLAKSMNRMISYWFNFRCELIQAYIWFYVFYSFAW